MKLALLGQEQTSIIEAMSSGKCFISASTQKLWSSHGQVYTSYWQPWRAAEAWRCESPGEDIGEVQLQQRPQQFGDVSPIDTSIKDNSSCGMQSA